MALTGSLDSPSQTANTPTVSTLTTGTLTAIRDRIQPGRGWWQFQWKPWHRWTIFGSYVVVVASFIAFAATHGAVR